MAFPHFQKGFTRLPNEFIEALMLTNLSPYQSRIIWAILRKTYGYQKTEDWISNSQFVALTRIRKGHVSRAVKELLNRSMITKNGKKLGIQEDPSQWTPLPKGANSHHKLPGKVTQLPRGVTKSYQRGSTQKKKRKYTKESEISNSFKKFYEAYPKHTAGKAAIEEWQKLNPDEALQEKILEAIEKQKRTPAWQQEEGKFIPSAAKWLAGELWNDEVKEDDDTW